MSERQSSLPHYLRVLRQQAWLIALTVALAIGATALLTSLQDPVYRASMKIVVGQGGGVFQPQFGSSVEPFTQTMTNLLESDIVATTTITNLGLELTPKKLLENLHVSSRPESSVLEISYDSPDREQGLAVLAEVGSVFSDLTKERLPETADAERLPITVSVFDPAHLEEGQVSPKPVRNLGVAGVLGLALGLVLAFARESLDDRIRTRRDAEEWLGAPVIGSLPKDVNGGLALGIPGSALSAKRLDIVEAFRLLSANLQFSRSGISGPVILVTSAEPGEGKSTVAANLSATLALAGQDVVCVEADLRRPTLHDYLGAQPLPYGFTDVIEGRFPLDRALQEVNLEARDLDGLKRTRTRMGPVDGSRNSEAHPATLVGQAPRGRLRVLLAGGPLSNPASALTAERVIGFLDDIRNVAQYVIFDTPPILFVGDAFPLVRAADSVLVVVRKGVTSRGNAEGVRTTLEHLGASKISVVMIGSDLQDERMYGYSSAPVRSMGEAEIAAWSQHPPTSAGRAKAP